MFLSHFEKANQIPETYGSLSITIILIIITLGILFSIVKNQKLLRLNERYSENRYFTMSTNNSLRGIALLLLIVGHLSITCIDGISFFEYAGRWAVVIFLFSSGMVLPKTYGFIKLNEAFLLRRIKRLLFPSWIALIVFYILEYVLLQNMYSPLRVLLNFFGVYTPAPPNGPAWFITYIIQFYVLYFLVSQINTRALNKYMILFFLSYVVMFCIIFASMLNRFSIWTQYTLVFPLSFLIGANSEKIFGIAKSLLNRFPLIFSSAMAMIFLLYFYVFGGMKQPFADVLTFKVVFKQLCYTVAPIPLIVALIMLSVILDSSKYESRVLSLLGVYSFEIYLVHYPFMVYYDFLLYRKPLIFFFFVYLSVIVLLGYLLRVISNYLNNIAFES